LCRIGIMWSGGRRCCKDRQLHRRWHFRFQRLVQWEIKGWVGVVSPRAAK